MIDGIRITNFKSHKDTKIIFHPGVNVFVGLSDHGKTNVIRAINWVANNRPLGEGVINRDSTKAMVEIDTSPAKGKKTDTIRRTKGKNVNEYVLNNGIPFMAFGSDPPPQIKEAMNLSEINLQRQFEPYFLVFDPPGQVATFIRSITKLDEIDSVITHIASAVRQNHIDTTVCNSEMADTLRNLGIAVRVDIDGLRQRVDRARNLIAENEKVNTTMDRLVRLVEQIDSIKRIELPVDLDEKFETVKKLTVLAEKLRLNISRMTAVVTQIQAIKQIALPDDIDEKLEQINRTTDRSEKIRLKIVRLREIITFIQQAGRDSITLPDLAGILNRLATTERKYNEGLKKRDRLLVLIDCINKIEESSSLNWIDQKAVESEVEDLRGQLTICPTCGSALDETSKEKVLHGHHLTN